MKRDDVIRKRDLALELPCMHEGLMIFPEPFKAVHVSYRLEFFFVANQLCRPWLTFYSTHFLSFLVLSLRLHYLIEETCQPMYKNMIRMVKKNYLLSIHADGCF
jgi:hypothetical protein